MLQLLSRTYWLAIPAVVAPAALAWWWSRLLRPSPGHEPAVLAERWWAYHWRVSFTTSLCTMFVIALSGWNAIWLLPFEFASLSFITHRTRCAMLGESWSWPAYVVWRLRVTTAFLGFWALIAAAPALVVNANAGVRWWLALALTVLALMWHRFYMRVLLAVLQATPLDRTDLEAAFGPVFERTAIVRPRLWRAGPSGGVLANAFALPSLSGGNVLLFDTLLERLEHQEIAAILAHEVAHLEHYAAGRLRRLYWGGCAAIPVAIVGSALLAALAPDLAFMAYGIWPVGVFVGLWVRSTRMQGNETRSDLRAVELCGSAEALIGGLIRIYSINHVPRRLSAVTEAQATHPSLARRIRDIRAHSGSVAVHRLETPLLLVSPERGRFALLDRDAVSFGRADDVHAASTIDDLRQRASQFETLPYSELIELRLVPSHTGTVALVAVDGHSQRRAIALQPSDVAAAQTALDVVDQLLVTAPAARPPSSAYRLTALISLLLAIISSSAVAIALPALLLLARPTRALIGALAAALAGVALMGLGDVIPKPTSAFLLLIVALVAVWQLRSARHEQPPTPIWIWIQHVAISIVPMAGMAMIAIDVRHLFDLHTVLRDDVWIVAAWMSAMGYLAASSSPALRRAAGALALVVTGAAWVASPWFLTSTGADPLITPMAVLQERQVALQLISHRTVDGEFSSVRLAPDGERFLLAASADEYDEAEEEGQPRQFLLGGFDGWTRGLSATHALFVDSDHVLLLDRESGGTSLRLEDTRMGHVSWRLMLPDVAAATFDVGADGRWRITEMTHAGFRRIDGHVGQAGRTETRWSVGDTGGYHPVAQLADEGKVALVVASRWESSALPWSDRWRWQTMLLAAGPTRTTALATTRQMVDCLSSPVEVNGFVCVTFDGREGRLWRFDPDRGLAPIGRTRGFIWTGTYNEPDRVNAMVNGRLVQMRLDTASLDVLLTGADDCGYDGQAVAGELVATVCAVNGETTVRRYRMNHSDTARVARIGNEVVQ